MLVHDGKTCLSGLSQRPPVGLPQRPVFMRPNFRFLEHMGINDPALTKCSK